MKKLLLSAVVALGAIYTSNAQITIQSTTFGSSAPAGWTQQKTTVDAAWEYGTTFGTNMQTYAPAQGDDAFVDDWDNNGTDVAGWDTLYTNSLNCTAYSHVFLNFNYNFWQDDGAETATVIASNDGGHTWNLVANMTDGGGAWTNNVTMDLTPFAGGQANVMLAFTYYNGYASVTNGYTAIGLGLENVVVETPKYLYDLGVTSQNLPTFIQNNTPTTISGSIYNYGGDSIAQMHLNYKVDANAPVSDALTSLSFNSLSSYNFTCATPWVPTTDGYHTIKIWADNLNGANADQNNSNDTLTFTVLVVDTANAKQVVYEEFMQASCNPCMFAAPNLDGVLGVVTAANICNPIRYHVDWPGTDYMNNEIESPFVGSRVSYYGVSGVPDAKLDGGTDSYPGGVTVQQIQTEAHMGSPFSINIKTAKYDATTNVYSATVEITSYSTYAAGLIANAVLTVDTIVYAADQSTEDPMNAFQPPVGNSSDANFPGGIPDSYYDYVVQFPNVAEDMMPSSSGSTLGAFSSGTTQTLNLSWTKNRPWGSSPKTYTYDSTFPGTTLTVFVQSPGAVAQLGLPAKYVYQSAAKPFTTVVGIEEIANGVYFELYPNPTNNNTNVSFKLDKQQNVSVSVYNVLGENVYSVNAGSMSAGSHNIEINGAALANGVYFVRFNTDNVTTTKRLLIQK